MLRPRGLTLIVNPTAGRGSAGRALSLIQDALVSRGADFETLLTTRRGEGESLASEAIARGTDMIVAVGGDGTLHEVSNAVLDATRPGVTLGLIPFGTGNDFARCVGLFGSVEIACAALFDGDRRMIDVGTVAGAQMDAPRRFLVAAGVGFVADTARTVNAGIRFLRGMPAYLYGALKTLQRFHPLNVTITSEDGTRRTFESMLISVSNVATTGGGMKIAPEAVPDDGLLDVCLVKAITRFELARQLPNVMQGYHVNHPAVEMLRVTALTIETERPASLWIDGEVTGTTPARFTLNPASLPIMLPSKNPSGAQRAQIITAAP